MDDIDQALGELLEALPVDLDGSDVLIEGELLDRRSDQVIAGLFVELVRCRNAGRIGIMGGTATARTRIIALASEATVLNSVFLDGPADPSDAA